MASEQQLTDAIQGSRMGPLGMLMSNGADSRLMACDVRGGPAESSSRKGGAASDNTSSHTLQLLLFVKCAIQRTNRVLLTFTLRLTSTRCYGNPCILISLRKRLV